MTEQLDFAIEPEFTLGWRIKRALDYGGLDHSALMERFEVSRQTVSRWCRDDGPAPKKYVLNEIAVMCGVSPRWLINGPSKDGDGPDNGGGLPLDDQTTHLPVRSQGGTVSHINAGRGPGKSDEEAA